MRNKKHVIVSQSVVRRTGQQQAVSADPVIIFCCCASNHVRFLRHAVMRRIKSQQQRCIVPHMYRDEHGQNDLQRVESSQPCVPAGQYRVGAQRTAGDGNHVVSVVRAQRQPRSGGYRCQRRPTAVVTNAVEAVGRRHGAIGVGARLCADLAQVVCCCAAARTESSQHVEERQDLQDGAALSRPIADAQHVALSQATRDGADERRRAQRRSPHHQRRPIHPTTGPLPAPPPPLFVVPWTC